MSCSPLPTSLVLGLHMCITMLSYLILGIKLRALCMMLYQLSHPASSPLLFILFESPSDGNLGHQKNLESSIYFK